MFGSRTIESELHVTPTISSEMEEAIRLWSDMYRGKPDWCHEPTPYDPSRVVSLGLPALISSEKARMATLEWQSEITAPTKEIEVKNEKYEEPQKDEFGNVIPSPQPEITTEDKPVGNDARAKYLESQYKKLKSAIRKQLEYGIAKGGLIIKPYVVDRGNVTKTYGEVKETANRYAIEFDYIQADNFYPLAFDANGNITEAAFIQTKSDSKVVYRRLEYHKLVGTTVTVINKAFKSTNVTTKDTVDLGEEIPLTEVYEWKDFPPVTTIENVDRPLFAYFKMPEANTVDPTSPLGASGFSRAVQLIKDADIQYSRLLWEYEGGEMAIDVDRDALPTVLGPDGKEHTTPNKLQARLFRRLDLGEGDTYQQFAPTLRDSAYIQGLNTILQRIEDAVGISRGTLSEETTSTARTATELRILKQRSYSTNAEIQKALEQALRDAIYVMDVYCTLYNITPDGEYDISFEWDDSILVDVEEELAKRITLLQNGLAGKLELRMWYFGETERQAREALLQIEEENNREMEQDLVMTANQMNLDYKNQSLNRSNNFGGHWGRDKE